MFLAILSEKPSYYFALSKDLIAVAGTSHVETDPHAHIDELLCKTVEELPILRQSCQDIIKCADDDASSANDLCEIIKHDQALLAKVITLANSASYYISQPVLSPFQAIQIIGCDVIRSAAIGAELIERAGEHGGNAAVLKKLLARAMISAIVAQELEEACKFRKNPNLFTLTMLYTLGDLVLAHFLPSIYDTLETALYDEPERVQALEQVLLGQTFQRLAGKLAKNFGLPNNIIAIIETKPNLSTQQWSTTHDRLAGLVVVANKIVNCLLSPPAPSVQASLEELLARLPKALNITPQDLKIITITAFQKSDQFSNILNIEQQYFVPHFAWKKLDRIAIPLKDFIGEILHPTHTVQEVNPPAKTVSST